MYNIRSYGSQFNPEVLKDLKKINDELQEEENKPEPDKDKILKFKQQQLMRGMELGNGYINFGRRHIPY